MLFPYSKFQPPSNICLLFFTLWSFQVGMCVCVCVCVCILSRVYSSYLLRENGTCERFSDELTSYFWGENHSPQLLSFSPWHFSILSPIFPSCLRGEKKANLFTFSHHLLFWAGTTIHSSVYSVIQQICIEPDIVLGIRGNESK